MSQGIVSTASQSCFLNHTKSSLPIPKSMFMEPSSCLSFNSTHVPKLGLCFKTQSGSLRTRPIKASGQCLCAPTTESFYDLLGISESVTPIEIKQAYKQLVLKYHPDVSPPERVEENTKRFILLQEAYETLSDPRSRALYDCDLATGSLLAFSAARYKEGLGEVGNWRIQWQTQLTELKRRSLNKDLMNNNISWGARIRQRNKTTNDECLVN